MDGEEELMVGEVWLFVGFMDYWNTLVSGVECWSWICPCAELLGEQSGESSKNWSAMELLRNDFLGHLVRWN